MAILDNLVGYWNLSEASGTRADSSGNGNDLTDNNTVTGTTGPGSHNASLLTSANSESLSHADNASLSTGDIDFTFCIWVKFTTIVSDMCIGGQINGSINERSWRIHPDATPKLDATVSSDGTATQAIVFTTTTLITATWYFCMFYHDSVNNLLGISVNNATVQTIAYTLGVHDAAASFAFGAQNTQTLNFLNGAIAMAGLWKRVLTSTEITTLYNSGNGLSYAEMAPAGQTPFPWQKTAGMGALIAQ